MHTTIENSNNKLMDLILNHQENSQDPKENLNVISLNACTFINKQCENGMTLLGAAAKTGNLPVIKLLLDFHKNKTTYLNMNYEHMPTGSVVYHKHNNEYLISEQKEVPQKEVLRSQHEVFSDYDSTPEGMEDLEWDLEAKFSYKTPFEEMEVDNFDWYALHLRDTPNWKKLDLCEEDIDQLDNFGFNVLHYAVISGHVEMVDYLMKNYRNKLSFEQNSSSGYNSLHNAVIHNQFEMVHYLIGQGVNLNSSTESTLQTPLHLAASRGFHEIIKILISAGCNVNVTDIYNLTPIRYAVKFRDLYAVQILCNSGSLINYEDNSGSAALEDAILDKNVQIARKLISHGARIIPSKYYLHSAIQNNDMEMVKLLVESGANINQFDFYKQTPLMTACSSGNEPIFRYLIDQGANVEIESNGFSALYYCIYIKTADKISMLQTLINHGANVNGSFIGPLLIRCMFRGDIESAKELIRHGASLEVKIHGCIKCDIMLWCCKNGDLHLCKIIIYAGFDIRNIHQNHPWVYEDNRISNFLTYVKKNPLKLSDLCRITIRKSIGSDRLHQKLYTLPLPNQIIQYLTLQILD